MSNVRPLFNCYGNPVTAFHVTILVQMPYFLLIFRQMRVTRQQDSVAQFTRAGTLLTLTLKRACVSRR